MPPVYPAASVGAGHEADAVGDGGAVVRACGLQPGGNGLAGMLGQTRRSCTGLPCRWLMSITPFQRFGEYYIVIRCPVERSRIADPRRAWQARIAAGLVAVGDEELMCPAVDNLLPNVHTHAPEGTTTVVSAYDDGDRVVVRSVSDNGRRGESPADPSCPSYASTAVYRAGTPSPAPRVPASGVADRHRDRRGPRRHRHGGPTGRGGCASPSPCPPDGGPRPQRTPGPAARRESVRPTPRR